jgi:hypothetical protein
MRNQKKRHGVIFLRYSKGIQMNSHDPININENDLDSYIESHNVYDLFRCPCCGTSWYEHEKACFYHHKKWYFNRMRYLASRIDKYKKIFENAKKNGYHEPSLELFNQYRAEQSVAEQSVIDFDKVATLTYCSKDVDFPINKYALKDFVSDTDEKDFECKCDEIIP